MNMATTRYNGRKSNQNESSAWFDYWCWSFAKFTGFDHGEVMELGENSLASIETRNGVQDKSAFVANPMLLKVGQVL